MDTKKQPEALRLAEMLTADEWPGSVTLVSYARECVAELLRQHAENETVRAGYAAARLEIESLKAQLHAAQTGEYPALVCDYCGALTPDPWHSSGMLHGKMSKHIHSCDACCRGAAQPATAAGSGGFDHKTAADFLTGKTVSDEAMRKFVTASRWAHDDRTGLQETLLSTRHELASREAEIALLKTELMDAEAAAKQGGAA